MLKFSYNYKKKPLSYFATEMANCVTLELKVFKVLKRFQD